jgi:hypothetical protein
MISEEALRRIEDQALDQFVSSGMSSKIQDDKLSGEIPEWTDADDYHMVAAECTIPAETIKEWLYGDFTLVLEKFLSDNGVIKISELTDPTEYNSPIEYFEYCMGLYREAEDYFWDRIYPELQDSYFEDHAEKSY